ncbi:MAG: twin-arginine translocase TatA/TatE family subunit [Alphaproteobacteria bacterium]
MGTFSIWHWLIVLVVVLILFGGGGKIPKLMRDMGVGINAFKKGLKEEDKAKAAAEPDKVIENEPAVAASSTVEDTDKAASG